MARNRQSEPMGQRIGRRQFFCRGAGALALVAGSGVFSRPSRVAHAQQTKVGCKNAELIKPGKLIVAYNGDMPGTGFKDGKLTGVDGELMMWIAEQLGLEVEPALMEWAAEIESVQARRVDVMHGMMGWLKHRTEVIAITDPIYYAGTLITQKKATKYGRLEDLKGKRIATIQGFGWIPELKKLPATLKLYDTSDAAVRDLLAGRIDALFADPPLINWVQQKNPDWDIHSIPVANEYDPQLPTLTEKYQIVIGLSLRARNLLGCFNDAIARMWQTCKNFEVAKKYGFGDRYWFEPPAHNPRIGVDRPQGWKYPTLPARCA